MLEINWFNMIKLYLQYKKTIIYSLGVIAIISGLILPDASAAKGICFGFASGIILMSVLNRTNKLKKASTVEGSDTTKLN